MAWYKLNPLYWWRRRLFREYQRGWIEASKDPHAHVKIPLPYTYVVEPGECFVVMPDDHQEPPWWVKRLARFGIIERKNDCRCSWCKPELMR